MSRPAPSRIIGPGCVDPAFGATKKLPGAVGTVFVRTSTAGGRRSGREWNRCAGPVVTAAAAALGGTAAGDRAILKVASRPGAPLTGSGRRTLTRSPGANG